MHVINTTISGTNDDGHLLFDISTCRNVIKIAPELQRCSSANEAFMKDTYEAFGNIVKFTTNNAEQNHAHIIQ